MQATLAPTTLAALNSQPRRDDGRGSEDVYEAAILAANTNHLATGRRLAARLLA